jgi:hypothetical protein
MFGIDALDTGYSELDRELGNRVILLHQAVRGYTDSMKELNLLIHQVSEITRVLLHLEDRFKYLLEKAPFSDELYRLICTLGFPSECTTHLSSLRRHMMSLTMSLSISDQLRHREMSRSRLSLRPPRVLQRQRLYLYRRRLYRGKKSPSICSKPKRL